MILSQDLKKLVSQLPDGVEVCAYEGERSGLCLNKGNETGWIEIGEDGIECDTAQHDIQAFHGDMKIPAPHCMKCGKEMIEQIGDTPYSTIARCLRCKVLVQLYWNKPIEIHPPKISYASWEFECKEE